MYDKLTNEVKVSESKHLKDKDNRTILEELHSATFNGKILLLISIKRYKKISGNAFVKEDDNPIAVILK